MVVRPHWIRKFLECADKSALLMAQLWKLGVSTLQVENMRWIKSGDVSPRSTQGEFARVSCFP
jgi:hypothetical protein